MFLKFKKEKPYLLLKIKVLQMIQINFYFKKLLKNKLKKYKMIGKKKQKNKYHKKEIF